jgi:hypothetical protein
VVFGYGVDRGGQKEKRTHFMKKDQLRLAHGFHSGGVIRKKTVTVALLFFPKQIPSVSLETDAVE